MSRWAHPTRPLAPIGACIAVLAIWWVVAHNGGAGWVQVLGDIVFGVLLIGLVGGLVALWRARISFVSSPPDGTAGVPLELRVRASTRLRLRLTEPQPLEVLVGPTGRDRGGTNAIRVVPAGRGVYETLTVDVASAAPFALQWWSRRVRLRLPVALHVAPRCGRPVPVPDPPSDDPGERLSRPRVDTGDFRGVVPYRAGDNRRLVHWPATAHAGRLMVRELERPSAGVVTVTVVLPLDPDAAERVAESALGTVVRLLERGAPVLLHTVEASGPVSAVVADRRSAGRRLARAVASPAQALSSAAGVAVAS